LEGEEIGNPPSDVFGLSSCSFSCRLFLVNIGVDKEELRSFWRGLFVDPTFVLNLRLGRGELRLLDGVGEK